MRPTTRSGKAASAAKVTAAEDSSRATHVELHLIHRGRVFERDAAGIERDAFADEHHGRPLALGTAVVEDDEARRLRAALSHGQEATHLLAPDAGLIEHLHAQGAVLLGHCAGAIRQIDRRAHIARQIGEVALRGHGRRDGIAMGKAAPGRRRGARSNRTCHQALEHRQWRALARFQIVDPIERAAGDLSDGAAEVVVIELTCRRPLDGDGGALDPRAGERCNRCCVRAPPGLACEAARGAEPGQQNPAGLDAGNLGEQQRLAHAAGEIATRDDGLDPARRGGIERARFRGELVLIENARDDTVDAERREPLRPKVQLHSDLLRRRLVLP